MATWLISLGDSLWALGQMKLDIYSGEQPIGKVKVGVTNQIVDANMDDGVELKNVTRTKSR